MRSNVDFRWARELKRNAPLREAYAALGRQYDPQRRFRQEWRDTRYQELVQEREKREAVAVSDGTLGGYLAYPVIAKCEGGGAA
eukprot:14833231-Alexandrium_andersonii.AAC.1